MTGCQISALHPLSSPPVSLRFALALRGFEVLSSSRDLRKDLEPSIRERQGRVVDATFT